ncbi:MAG TPA: hypothetical protein VGH32_06905 [Pirellulales bacterium]
MLKPPRSTCTHIGGRIMGRSAPGSPVEPRRRLIYWAVAVAVVVETITLWLRFGRGMQASEFNKTAPLVLRIHHMFWAAPLLFIAPFLMHRQRIFDALVGISVGLIASDLAHHFMILPILTGTTGWHWP